jgi:hypothetical protein
MIIYLHNHYHIRLLTIFILSSISVMVLTMYQTSDTMVICNNSPLAFADGLCPINGHGLAILGLAQGGAEPRKKIVGKRLG